MKAVLQSRTFNGYDFILSSENICCGPCILEYRKYQKDFSVLLVALKCRQSFVILINQAVHRVYNVKPEILANENL